jgi:hypothetical protein
MARLPITVQTILRTGIEPTLAAPQASGENDGRTYIEVVADGTAAASTNITFETPNTIDGQAIASRVVALLKSHRVLIGPFPAGVYNQPGTNTVWFDCSAVITGLTAAVIRL